MPNVKERKLLKVDLQLFNDGGAAGAEGSVAATESAPKVETKPSGSNRRSKSGEFSNVVFGKQESAPENETTSLDSGGNPPTGAGETDVKVASNTLEERRKAYNDLINGEYKDIDQERFQEVFDRRFEQVKSMEADLAAQKPILDKLMARYGVNDVAKLDKALTEDTEYWEKVADERGMTLEQYQEMQKIEQENIELKAFRQREEGRAQIQQQVEAWSKEAEAVKKLYPSFDIRAELQNKQFNDMLKVGIPMEHAYRILHFEELTNDAVRIAVQTADAQAQARIKQKASRPSENGTSSQSAAIVKDNVANLTREERAEIARRVARGEIIRF